MLNPIFFLVVTTPMAYLQDVSEGSKLGSRSDGYVCSLRGAQAG